MATRRNRNITENSPQRWRGCVGKVRHPSRRKAIGAARALVAAGVFDGMAVYHCRICHRWHLSTKLPRKKTVKVQDLIEALQALPLAWRELPVFVYTDEMGGVGVDIESVELCNTGGARVGLKAPAWFPDRDDYFGEPDDDELPAEPAVANGGA